MSCVWSFFFFKQKTAYELRISDWSSDVCSSDLLFTAGEHHDAELRDYLDAPVDAPIVAAFDLAPGAAKTVRAIALLPKEAVNVVTVQGRPMFVPLVAINAVYNWDGGDDLKSSRLNTRH